MGWKNWSYWLRGGVMGGIIFFILFGDIFAYSFNFISYAFIPLSFLKKIFVLLGIKMSSIFNIFITFIFMLLEGFILGSLIGYIYGKIKNRKKGEER